MGTERTLKGENIKRIQDGLCSLFHSIEDYYSQTSGSPTGTYQNDRVPNRGIFAYDSTVDILAELGRVVIHIREVDVDSGHGAESWGAPIFGFHH